MRERNHLTRCLQRDWGFRTFTSPFIFMPQIEFTEELVIESSWVEFNYYPDRPLLFPKGKPQIDPDKAICGFITLNVGTYLFDVGDEPDSDYVLSLAHRGIASYHNDKYPDYSPAQLADLEPYRIARTWLSNVEKHKAWWEKDKRRGQTPFNKGQVALKEWRITQTQRLAIQGFSQSYIATTLRVQIRAVKRYYAILRDRLGINWLKVVEAIKKKSHIKTAKKVVSKLVSAGVILLHGQKTSACEPSVMPISTPAVTDVSCSRGVKPLTTARMKRPKEYWIKFNREKRENAARYALLDAWLDPRFDRIGDEHLREVAQEGYLAWSAGFGHTPTLGKVRQWLVSVLGKDGRGTELQAKLESVFGVA